MLKQRTPITRFEPRKNERKVSEGQLCVFQQTLVLRIAATTLAMGTAFFGGTGAGASGPRNANNLPTKYHRTSQKLLPVLVLDLSECPDFQYHAALPTSDQQLRCGTTQSLQIVFNLHTSSRNNNFFHRIPDYETDALLSHLCVCAQVVDSAFHTPGMA